MHPRQQIRERVVSKLLDATIAEDRVYDSHPWNVWPEHTPAVYVLAPRDDIELFRQAPATVKGECTIELALFARARKTSVSAAPIPAPQLLDLLIEQVLAVLEADPLLRDDQGDNAAAAANPGSGFARSIETTFEDGDRGTMAGARISIRYSYLRELPTGSIPPELDLQIIHTSYELVGGNNDEPEAVDSSDVSG